MDEVTIGAIVLLAIGAVITYLVTQHGRRIERFIKGDPGVRATIEVNAPVERGPVRIETDPAIFEAGLPNWEGYGYVFPDRSAPPPDPPGSVCREWQEWARANRAIDADTTKVQVIVEGTAERVTIDGIDVEVQRRGDPLSGVHALCQVGGASASPREVMVELDYDPPRVHYLAPGGEPSEPFLFTLTRGEAEVFRIYAFATTCDCEWVAHIHYVADGGRQSLLVSDHGDPFRTTASSRTTTFAWMGQAWVRQPHTKRSCR
jgi:hypothetical protein